MTVGLAIYLAVVSLAYFTLSVVAPAFAAAALVGFVALLVIPVCISDVRRAVRRRRGP